MSQFNHTLPYAEFEQALYDRLREWGANRRFTTYGALNPMPLQPSYPHVEINAVTGFPFDTSSSVANLITPLLVCRSRGRRGVANTIDVAQIASYVTEGLTGYSLTLDSDEHTVIGMHRDVDQGVQVVTEIDGDYVIRVMTLRFRYLVQTYVENTGPPTDPPI